MPTPIDLRGFKGRVRPTIDPARELPAPEREGLLAAPERRQDEPITVADAFPGALFAWEAPEFDYRPENTKARSRRPFASPSATPIRSSSATCSSASSRKNAARKRSLISWANASDSDITERPPPDPEQRTRQRNMCP